MRKITAEDWQEWAEHPVTQAFLTQLQESKATTLEYWAEEAFIGASIEQGAVMNATALGGVRVLTNLIEQIQEAQKAGVL